MSEPKSSPLPTEQTAAPLDARDGPIPDHIRQAAADARARIDARFRQPTPSPLKRVALLLFVALLFWFAIKLRISNKAAQPQVFHTDR